MEIILMGDISYNYEARRFGADWLDFSRRRELTDKDEKKIIETVKIRRKNYIVITGYIKNT